MQIYEDFNYQKQQLTPWQKMAWNSHRSYLRKLKTLGKKILNPRALTSMLPRHLIHEFWLSRTGKPVTITVKTPVIDYSDFNSSWQLLTTGPYRSQLSLTYIYTAGYNKRKNRSMMKLYSHTLVEKDSYCLVLEPTWPRRSHHCRDLQPPLGILMSKDAATLFYLRYYFSHI